MAALCTFCEIISRNVAAHLVLDDEVAIGFLDHRPVFKGHVLLAPREHIETLADLPEDLIQPFFSRARALASAVESALEADGTFVAINNRVSQSVPHMHVHVVPRRRKDGLRGFFWPRTKYATDQEVEQYAERIRAAIAR